MELALFVYLAGVVDNVIVYKAFPKGIKDKPRFPTFSRIWGTYEDWKTANET